MVLYDLLYSHHRTLTEELTPNRALKDNNGRTYDIIFGDFLVTGLTEENFGSLSDELIEKYTKFFYF